MATTGILGANNVIFYHPLDDFVESAVGQAWTGSIGITAGKIGTGASAVTGDAFSAGPDNTYDTFVISPEIAALSGTQVVATYKNSANRAIFRVGTVSGIDLTWSADLDMGATISNTVGVAGMSDTTALVAFRSQTDAFGHAHIVTVSGAIATLGPATVFGNNFATFEIRKLDSTHGVIAFARAPGTPDGTVVVATIAGTDITIGQDNQFDTNISTFTISLTVLDVTKILVGWRTSTSAGNVVAGTVAGDVITYGSSAIVVATGVVTNIRVSVVKLTSTTAFIMYFTDTMRARIATISGTDVTFGVETSFLGAGVIADGIRVASSSTELAVVFRVSTNTNLVKVTVSGNDITIGAATNISAGIVTVSFAIVPVSADTVVALFSENGPNTPSSKVGILDLSASLTAPTPVAYPDATGNDRLVVAMWANKLGAGTSVITAQRDFTVVFDATSISLGPATAVWSSGAVGTLMGTTMAGGEHFLVLDFENTGGGNWTLGTSLDGAAFVPQGAQTSGARTTAPASLTPGLSIVDGASGQWIDELVMWTGDKTTFESFTTQELANLQDLADVFGETMNQFEQNFGAPLCWQATANMPDGSVWRDSGSGPCPPVIRVPKGADDIMVTDDGHRARPRIIEG